MSNPRRILEKAKPTDPANTLPLQAFQPFNQFDWPKTARRVDSFLARAESYVNRLPLLSFMPFSQSTWLNPTLARSSAAARDMIPGGGSVGPIPPSFRGFEWLARARRRNRR